MTEREALKMALEALENTTPTGFNMERDKQFFAAIAAIKEVLAQPEQEPVARYFEDYQGQPIEEIDEARFNQTPEECRFKLYTAPPQPEQSQVEETLRYEIDALEAKLAECRAQQQEPVIGTKTWFEDGKVVTQHLTAKDIYKEPEQEPVVYGIRGGLAHDAGVKND